MKLHRDSRRLILNLRDPAKLLDLTPTAESFTHNGHPFVLLPHRTPEVKILKNMGFSPPHPVDEWYDWPGLFEPMEAQRETVRFLTLHNRAYCLNGLGCVDAETEYLTPAGWRRVDTYDGGPVAQYWPETGCVDFVDNPEYVKLPCSEMFHIKTKYGLDQMLSPEHRVLLVSNDSPGKQEVVQAWELYQRQEQWVATGRNKKSLKSIGWSKAAIPVTYAPPGGVGVPITNAELRVQIAVIADGHFPNASNSCTMRLKKQRKVERIRDLLQGAAIPFKERAQNTATAQGFTVFTFCAPTHDKEFGSAFWEATPDQLAVIRDEVLHWDGCIRQEKPTREFISNSKASADFVQYAFNAGGYTARIVVDDRGPTYSVIIRDNGKALTMKSTSGLTRNRTMQSVPSPDGFKYCFMVPSTFLILRRNGCVFASGNTGKTISALWAFDYLRTEGLAKKMLIVAPLSTLERTWGDEVFKHFPHLTAVVLHACQKSARIAKLKQDADIYIINHDGVKVMQEELAARKDIDTLVIDEISQCARNARTDMWRALSAIVSNRARVWGLTGTPTPNAPTDAWAQCRLLTPETVPAFFSHWRAKTMTEHFRRWIPKDDALETVHAAMQPAIRFKREDCVDLPPVMHETRTVEMTKDQARLYKDMQNALYAQFQGGEILAVNAAVQAMRLVQIASGAAYDPHKKPVVILPKPRLDAVLEVIEEAESKVIVFVPFKVSLQMVAEAISQHYSTEMIYGEVSKNERDRIFGAFQTMDDPKVLVAQPAAMSHGLTLTAASVIVWFAPVSSAETYEQANGRISRPGQKFNQLIMHIEGSPIERKMYQALKDRTNMQSTLLGLFQSNKD